MRIAAEKNLGYIVREYYLYDSVDEHLNRIEEIMKEKIYSEKSNVAIYRSAV